jgi:hypothetical protein
VFAPAGADDENLHERIAVPDSTMAICLAKRRILSRRREGVKTRARESAGVSN